MKKKALLVLAIASISAMVHAAPSNLEEVVNQARADGATIIECRNGLCYDRDTFGPAPDIYQGSQDGIYIDYKDPVNDSFKLLSEASRLVKETQAGLKDD